MMAIAQIPPVGPVLEHDERITRRADWDQFKIHPIDDTTVPTRIGDALEYEHNDRFAKIELTPESILRRFGPGRYKCHLYATLDDKTIFRSATCGFVVDDIGGLKMLTPPSRRRKGESGENQIEKEIKPFPEVQPMASPVAIAQTVIPPPVIAPDAVPPPVADPMALFVWMANVAKQERELGEQRLERERARDRQDNEDRIRREREHGERAMLNQQAFFDSMMKLHRNENKSPDPALAEVLRRIDEMQDSIEEIDDRAPSVKQGDVVTAVKALGEMVAPYAPMILAKLEGGTGGGTSHKT